MDFAWIFISFCYYYFSNWDFWCDLYSNVPRTPPDQVPGFATGPWSIDLIPNVVLPSIKIQKLAPTAHHLLVKYSQVFNKCFPNDFQTDLKLNNNIEVESPMRTTRLYSFLYLDPHSCDAYVPQGLGPCIVYCVLGPIALAGQCRGPPVFPFVLYVP